MIKTNGEDSLYTLIEKLGLRINNQEYIGIIAGYSTIDALIPFTTNIGSKHRKKRLDPQAIQEFKFSEIKTIYSKINDVIKNLNSDNAYHTTVLLQSSVERKIKEIFENYEQQESVLLKNIIFNFKKDFNYQKTFPDNLRKKGIALVQIIKDNGLIIRRHDYLTKDYNSIEKIFIKEKKYEL